MTTALTTTPDPPSPVDPPTRDPVVAAAAIRPLLRLHREQGDRQRRLTGEAMAALIDAGQFRTQVARRYGGLECELSTVLEATAELAKGDPSAGWLAMILSCADWLVGLFPDRAQQDVYRDGPDTRVCAVLSAQGRSRAVPGGWLVDGRWSPSSGCREAQWAALGVVMATGRGEPEQPVLALVPLAQLAVEDTWHTIGMRATASDTLTASGVFVPAHRVLPLRPAIEGSHPGTNPGSLFRAALVPLFVTHMMAPYLGMAQAALEHVLDTAPDRPVTFTHYTRKADSTAFQLGIAAAATRIDAAWALARRAASTVEGHAARRHHPEQHERARIRGWTGYVVAECRAAVDLLASAQGASTFAEHGLLGAIVRDMHTASRHAIASPEANAEIYGKALLRVTPNISELV